MNDNDDNVVPFTGGTYGDIETDVVLDSAKGKLQSLVMIGTTSDDELYFASSMGDAKEILWLIKLIEAELLDRGRGIE